MIIGKLRLRTAALIKKNEIGLGGGGWGEFVRYFGHLAIAITGVDLSSLVSITRLETVHVCYVLHMFLPVAEMIILPLLIYLFILLILL